MRCNEFNQCDNEIPQCVVMSFIDAVTRFNNAVSKFNNEVTSMRFINAVKRALTVQCYKIQQCGVTRLNKAVLQDSTMRCFNKIQQTGNKKAPLQNS